MHTFVSLAFVFIPCRDLYGFSTLILQRTQARQQVFIAIPTVFPQTYPDGYPDSLLPRLGHLASLITVKDVSKWKITSADTLASLLELDLQNEQVGIWVCFPAQVCFLVWELLV